MERRMQTCVKCCRLETSGLTAETTLNRLFDGTDTGRAVSEVVIVAAVPLLAGHGGD